MPYDSPKEELKVAKQRLKEAEQTLKFTREQRNVYVKALDDWSNFTSTLAARGRTTQSQWDALFSQHTWLVEMDSTLQKLEAQCERNIEKARVWVKECQERAAS